MKWTCSEQTGTEKRTVASRVEQKEQREDEDEDA
jgi:hypothetical protein